jgi:hypothetical protein
MMMATTSVLPPVPINSQPQHPSNDHEGSPIAHDSTSGENDQPSGPHVFQQPAKCIHDNHDFEAFVRSSAYHEILGFVKACAEAVVDKPNSYDAPEVSAEDNADTASNTASNKFRRHHHAKRIIQRFVDFMNELYEQVNEIPPLQQPMRFGNKAFRLWHTKLMEKSPAFIRELLQFHMKELEEIRQGEKSEPTEECTSTEVEREAIRQQESSTTGDSQDEILNVDNLDQAVAELAPYLFDMFGNATRIDYGTGHELNFAIFFLLLIKLQILQETSEDLVYIVTRAFVAYIRTMRKLQHDYMLEPAGSHGVWGLDDYHCLLFLWGSAQLSKQSDNDIEMPPACIHDDRCLAENQSEYLYLEGVAFIKKIKHGAPFAETSPMLNDISHINHWAKVCSGLMKLFQGEVLNKFPVIQHILFGSLLQWKK